VWASYQLEARRIAVRRSVVNSTMRFSADAEPVPEEPRAWASRWPRSAAPRQFLGHVAGCRLGRSADKGKGPGGLHSRTALLVLCDRVQADVAAVGPVATRFWAR
jgi:hypothetical protein